LTFPYFLAHLNNSSTADFFRVRIVVGSAAPTVFEELGGADDDDAVWATASVNLSQFAGQTIRILIEATDNATGSLIGAGVDDVRITGLKSFNFFITKGVESGEWGMGSGESSIFSTFPIPHSPFPIPFSFLATSTLCVERQSQLKLSL
jgi:hypothetical protein